MESVNLRLLETLYRNMAGRTRYRLGAKAPGLTCDSSAITHIDCSGWARYALARATAGGLVIPDGSVQQRAWCEQHLRRLAQYRDVRYAAGDPSRLFVAFLPPSAIRKGSAGHVWLARAGRTMESYAGIGVGSRPWDAEVLLRHASAAYELPAE